MRTNPRADVAPRPLSRPRRVLLALVMALACGLASLSPAHGQLSDRSAVIRVLRESRDFRARTRAALALGASADPTMAAPLAAALGDESPAVRAAAADGLARVGGPTQIGALRSLARDPERQVRDAATRAITAIEARVRAVRTATPAPSSAAPPAPAASAVAPRPGTPLAASPAPPSTAPAPALALPAIHWEHTRYVVVLGTMANGSGYPHATLTNVLRGEVVRSLSSVRGVGILAEAPSATHEQEITRRHIRRYRVDGNIRTVRPEPGRDVRVRCEVSIMLLDDPGANLRAALNGAATGTEPARGGSARPQQEQRLAERAVQGAVRSAMNGASRAISQAGR